MKHISVLLNNKILRIGYNNSGTSATAGAVYLPVGNTEGGGAGYNRGRAPRHGWSTAARCISTKTIKTCIVQFDAFQDFVGKKYNFDDIDLNFRNEYLAFLYTEKKYSTNTAAKCIENLATIFGSAVAEGHTKNVKFQDRRFKTSRVEVDSIYLTKKELQAFCNADLSKESPGYEIARDIFMVGVYTAQRVSDYNNISREDIKISDDGSVIINIRQQKTRATVMIPAKPELVAILEKYNYELPHLADKKK